MSAYRQAEPPPPPRAPIVLGVARRRTTLHACALGGSSAALLVSLVFFQATQLRCSRATDTCVLEPAFPALGPSHRFAFTELADAEVVERDSDFQDSDGHQRRVRVYRLELVTASAKKPATYGWGDNPNALRVAAARINQFITSPSANRLDVTIGSRKPVWVCVIALLAAAVWLLNARRRVTIDPARDRVGVESGRWFWVSTTGLPFRDVAEAHVCPRSLYLTLNDGRRVPLPLEGLDLPALHEVAGRINDVISELRAARP